MNKIYFFLGLIFCTTLFPYSLKAQTQDEIESRELARIDELTQKHKHAEAYQVADSLVNILKIQTTKSYEILAKKEYNMGLLAGWDNKREDEEKYFLLALQHFKQSNSLSLVIMTYSALCDSYKMRGLYHKGAKLAAPAIDFCSQHSNDNISISKYTELICDFGDMFAGMNDYNTALAYYSEVMNLCAENKLPRIEMETAIKQVTAMTENGYDVNKMKLFHRNMELAFQALQKSGECTNYDSVKYYTGQVTYYEIFNNYPLCITYWDSASIVFDKILDQKEKEVPGFNRDVYMNYDIWDCDGRIEIVNKIGMYDEFQKLVKLAETKFQNDTSIQMANFCRSIAEGFSQYDNFEQCRKFSRKSYEILNKEKASVSIESFRMKQMELKSDIALNDYSNTKQTISILEKILPTVFRNEQNLRVINFYEDKAFSEYFMGNKNALITNLTKSTDLIHQYMKNNFVYLNDDEYMQLWNRVNIGCSKALLGALMTEKYNPDYAKKVYQIQLDQKNMQFVAQNRTHNLLKSQPELEDIYNDLSTIKKMLRDPENNLSEEQQISMTYLATELENKIINKFPSDISNILDVDFDKAKSKLADGEIAVEFSEIFSYENYFKESHPELCNYNYVAIVFNNKSQAPEIIPIFTKKEFEDYKLSDNTTLKKALEQRLPNNIKAIYEDEKLCDFIWKKIFDKFGKPDKIYFSPTGYLYSVALENLKYQDSLRMNDAFKMQRISSTAQITTAAVDFNFNKILMYGGINYTNDVNTQASIVKTLMPNIENRYCQRVKLSEKSDNKAETATRKMSTTEYKYLHSTFEECEYIERKAIGKDVTFIKGDSAVEESFKIYAGKNQDIIHVASHGYYNDNIDDDNLTDYAILNSTGLVFAGVNNYLQQKEIPYNIDDGILTTDEISDLDLSNTKLAVLSACETGLGHVNANGLFGLQRGFKLAGVKSILITLWSISDEGTSQFMRKFYTSLTQGKTPRESLQIAQQYLRDGNRFSHPFFWAGFVLVD